MNERTVSQSIPSNQVLTIAPEATAFDAACLMTKAKCGSIIVVTPSGAMQGIVTERDLMTKVVSKASHPKEVSVAEIMTRNPRYVTPDTAVSEAVMIMKEGGFRHLPILANHAKLVGMFSIRDASPRDLIEADRRAGYLDLLSESVGY